MIEIITIIVLAVFVAILLASSYGQYKINIDLENELNEQIEINESLKKDIKFQSNVNKTLREGLDAITKKNCHVKDKNAD